MDEKGLPGLEHVLKTFPNLTLIAHSFWWKHLSEGTCDRLLKTYPNLYADISATVRMSRIGTDKEFARAFFIRNADKLLFGSDSGWWSFGKGKKPVPEFALIDELNLPAAVADKICRGNAQRLFWPGKPGNATLPGRSNMQGFVEALDFYRAAKGSPNAKQSCHYFHSAGAYTEIGNAMGWAM